VSSHADKAFRRQLASETTREAMLAPSPHGRQGGEGDQSPPRRGRPSPSLVRHRPHHCSVGRGVVIEHLIEKSFVVIIYPVLTSSNYSEWSLVIMGGGPNLPGYGPRHTSVESKTWIGAM
jgi:hypothetical protein